MSAMNGELVRSGSRGIISGKLKSMDRSSSIVFLVDDDSSVRDALARLIKSRGFKVQTFSSAREFLDSDWRSRGTACLVLDVRMPGLSGLDLQHELQVANASLPIIFITGHGDFPIAV